MEQRYSLKYGNFFAELTKFKNILGLSLKVYLKIYSIKNIQTELTHLIFQVKDNMVNKSKDKLNYEFHEIFCKLIENVVANFENKDLSNHILDNYGIAQLSLCNMVVEWITTKEEVKINKIEIDRIFSIIFKFVRREFGEEYFYLPHILGLYKIDDIKKIDSPISAVINASNIIKNIHPIELNSAIIAFVLKNSQKFEKYDTRYLQIVPCDKKNFNEKYRAIIKLLTIIERMEKYDDKNRFDFFIEFKGDNKFLNEINLILKRMNKKPLINLVDQHQDIELIIENNFYLIKKNKELSDDNKLVLKDLEQKIKEVDELKAKSKELQTKANSLKTELSKKKDQIKKMDEINNSISGQLFHINFALNEAKNKINNHLQREICLKVEDYFYYIVSPSRREKIDRELKDQNEDKISIYLRNIENEYPKYFSKIKNEGIDYSSFLYKINHFRKKNNDECHDKKKVNYNSMITTLNYYYENKFDFKKHFDFMANNFAQFKAYIFDEKENPGNEISECFKKKEIDA